MQEAALPLRDDLGEPPAQFLAFAWARLLLSGGREERVRRADAIALDEKHTFADGAPHGVHAGDPLELGGPQVRVEGDGQQSTSDRRLEVDDAQSDEVLYMLRHRQLA